MNHMQPNRYRSKQNWMSNVSNNCQMPLVKPKFNIQFHYKPLSIAMALTLHTGVWHWMLNAKYMPFCYRILHNELTKWSNIFLALVSTMTFLYIQMQSQLQLQWNVDHNLAVSESDTFCFIHFWNFFFIILLLSGV